MEVDTCSNQQTDQVQCEQFLVHGSNETTEAAGTWGYRRCLDFDANGSRGQDFCAVRGGAGYVVGIVADGVSQSYFGDIAAREVSQYLVDYLWQQRAAPPPEPDIEERLLALSRKVDLLVQQTRPTNPTLEEALAPIREKNGSQTVFAAFILDFRGHRRNLTLYQVGDIFTWVFDREHGRHQVKPDPNGRWSSRGRSDLRLQARTFVDVTGIVIHSDGLGSGWVAELAKPCVLPHRFEAEAGERAKDDDLSFITFEIRPSIHLNDPKAPEGKTATTSPGVIVGPPPSTQRQSSPQEAPAVDQLGKAAAEVMAPRSVSRSTGSTRTSGRSGVGRSSIKRHWSTHGRPSVGSFMAGFIMGGIAALLVIAVFFWPPVEQSQGTPIQNGNPADHEPPAPGGQVTLPAPIKELIVSPRPQEQQAFLDTFGNVPQPQDGDVIAHIELPIDGTLRISAGPAKTAIVQKTQKCSADKSCFLAYLPGPATPDEVVFEVVDEKGVVLSRGQAPLPGREPKEVGRNRFLGYYDIHLNPAGESGGNS